MKLSQVQKITLSGLLLALTIILTRVTPLQNFPLIPWVRISLGPSLIIFASILLGPIFGAIVGAGSDILGIVLFPNSLGYGINPLFTLVYGLLGVLPWLLYFLVKKLQVRFLEIGLVGGVSILVFLALVYFIFFSPTIAANYSFELWHKILIVSIAFVLLMATVILLFVIERYYKKKYGELASPFKVAFVVLVSEVLLMLLLNSFVKTFTFGVNFWIIFFAQAIVFFIDVPLNTFVVEGLLLLTYRIKNRRS